jgi:hypothetical protein
VPANDPFRIKIDSTEVSAPSDLSALYADLEREIASTTSTATPLPADVAGETPLPQRPTPPPAKIVTPAPVSAATPAPTRPPVCTETPAPVEDRPLTKYEELCRTRSLTIGKADVGVIAEFSQVIAAMNEVQRQLDKVLKTHPEHIPERLANLVRENMRESAQTMLKELHAMRNGRVQKKYDKRCICTVCHSVFLVPLPADNICDACRASSVPRSAPY